MGSRVFDCCGHIVIAQGFGRRPCTEPGDTCWHRARLMWLQEEISESVQPQGGASSTEAGRDFLKDPSGAHSTAPSRNRVGENRFAFPGKEKTVVSPHPRVLFPRFQLPVVRSTSVCMQMVVQMYQWQVIRSPKATSQCLVIHPTSGLNHLDNLLSDVITGRKVGTVR